VLSLVLLAALSLSGAEQSDARFEKLMDRARKILKPITWWSISSCRRTTTKFHQRSVITIVTPGKWNGFGCLRRYVCQEGGREMARVRGLGRIGKTR